MILIIKGLFVTFSIITFSINDAKHNSTSTECHYAECHILFIVMLGVVMLGVVELGVIMLNVILLSVMAPFINTVNTKGSLTQATKRVCFCGAISFKCLLFCEAALENQKQHLLLKSALLVVLLHAFPRL
jgi:hypothetical protein